MSAFRPAAREPSPTLSDIPSEEGEGGKTIEEAKSESRFKAKKVMSGFAAGLQAQLTAAMEVDAEVNRVKTSLTRQITDLK